jgi:crotonobetainyl-CoA:carnitine CoA-transferase CaiB-like acyl-CoA transferase
MKDRTIDDAVAKIKQAYTQAHAELGGSDVSTIEERWKREAEIIEEAKQAIKSYTREQVVKELETMQVIEFGESELEETMTLDEYLENRIAELRSDHE